MCILIIASARLEAWPYVRIGHTERPAVVVLILHRCPAAVVEIGIQRRRVQSLIVDHWSAEPSLALVTAAQRTHGTNAFPSTTRSEHHRVTNAIIAGPCKWCVIVVLLVETRRPPARKQASLAEYTDISSWTEPTMTSPFDSARNFRIAVSLPSPQKQERAEEQGSNTEQGANDRAGYCTARQTFTL